MIKLTFLVPSADGQAIALDASTGRAPSWGVDGAEPEVVAGKARRWLAAILAHDLPLLEVFGAPPIGDRRETVLAVAEPMPAGLRVPSGWRWRDNGPEATSAFPKSLHSRATTWLAELRLESPVPAARPPWARAGWHAAASEWASEVLVRRRMTGPLEQLRMWGVSSLLRAPTTGGTVYLKGLLPSLKREPGVMSLIGSVMPEAVPTVIAAEPDRGWMLLEDLGPRRIVDGFEMRDWRDAQRRLIAVQRAFAARSDDLIAVGCPIWEPKDLANRVAGLADEPALTDRTSERLAEVAAIVQERAERLSGLGLPRTIVHGDFDATNVALLPTGPVIFDWSDARIANPLYDLAMWLYRVAGTEHAVTLLEDYVDAWSGVVPADVLRGELDDVLIVATAYTAAGYAEIVRSVEPALRSELLPGFGWFLGDLERRITAVSLSD